MAGDPTAVRAAWRGLTTVDPRTGTACLSFTDEVGGTHRFALTPVSLGALAGAVDDVLGGQPVRTNVQRDNSLGSPARDVSIPFEGENT